MISQKYRAEKTQRREQAQSPDEQRSMAPPASSWQGLKWLARVLGVIVPLGGSFVVGVVETQPSANMLLVLGLLGTSGTLLLQSIWATALVPAALFVGLLLGAVLPALLQGGGIELQQCSYLVDMALFLGAFALLGASLGIQPAESI